MGVATTLQEEVAGVGVGAGVGRVGGSGRERWGMRASARIAGGGRRWWRSMGVWSWTTRGVWRGIIWLLVLSPFLFPSTPGELTSGSADPERTYLAWLRTSLAFASIGIAITQLFRLNTTITDREGLTPVPTPPGTLRLRQVGKPLGATFLAIAIVVLVVGVRRYFESQVCVF